MFTASHDSDVFANINSFLFSFNRQLRYVGQSETGDKSRSTLLRSCVEVLTSDNVTTFLKELGFRSDVSLTASPCFVNLVTPGIITKWLGC